MFPGFIQKMSLSKYIKINFRILESLTDEFSSKSSEDETIEKQKPQAGDHFPKKKRKTLQNKSKSLKPPTPAPEIKKTLNFKKTAEKQIDKNKNNKIVPENKVLIKPTIEGENNLNNETISTPDNIIADALSDKIEIIVNMEPVLPVQAISDTIPNNLNKNKIIDSAQLLKDQETLARRNRRKERKQRKSNEGNLGNLLGKGGIIFISPSYTNDNVFYYIIIFNFFRVEIVILNNNKIINNK